MYGMYLANDFCYFIMIFFVYTEIWATMRIQTYAFFLPEFILCKREGEKNRTHSPNKILIYYSSGIFEITLSYWTFSSFKVKATWKIQVCPLCFGIRIFFHLYGIDVDSHLTEGKRYTRRYLPKVEDSIKMCT